MSRTLFAARYRRVLGGLFAATLPAALLLTAAPGAQAADASTFTWKVSEQFVAHFAKASYNQNTFVASDGATLDEDSATVFGDGTGWVNSTTGDASLQYAGTITGSFVVGVPQYSIAISDPAITIKDGAGQITADVAWTVPSDAADPSGEADDVVVTTFDATASDWSDGALTATPDWSTQSFDPEFINALNPGLQAHFRASGTSSDARKAPAEFTATAAAPAATATVTQADDGSATIDVNGTGYQPGGVGIYVGVTEAGEINPTDAEAYTGTQWVNGSQIAADGSFATTLELTAEEVAGLDPDASYEAHTMKAHGQAATDPSQNVRIPIELTIPAEEEEQAATAAATATVTQAEDGSASIAVNGTGYQPGGVGIYVGVTEAGEINPTDAGAYTGTQWLNGNQIAADGTWSTTLELTAEEVAGLDPDASYEVHTMKAHGQAATDPSQNVRIPIELTFASDEEEGTDEGTDDGTTDDGATDDGTTDDGATDDGTTDDVATDDGTTDDVATDDAATDDGAASDPEVPAVVQTDGIGVPREAVPALGAIAIGLLVGTLVGLRRRMSFQR